VPGLIVGAELVAATFASPLTWSDRDSNGDGHVSLSELVDRVDVGVRSTSEGAKACRQFFYLKDGFLCVVDVTDTPP